MPNTTPTRQRRQVPYHPAGAARKQGRRRLGGLIRQIWAALGASSPNRPRRIVLLLLLVWVVGMYDLILTLAALRIGGFQELNPVARLFLHSPVALIAFKLLLMFPASVVFLIYRRRILTEIGCWVLAAAYAALAFVWMAYYLRPK